MISEITAAGASVQDLMGTVVGDLAAKEIDGRGVSVTADRIVCRGNKSGIRDIDGIPFVLTVGQVKGKTFRENRRIGNVQATACLAARLPMYTITVGNQEGVVHVNSSGLLDMDDSSTAATAGLESNNEIIKREDNVIRADGEKVNSSGHGYKHLEAVTVNRDVCVDRQRSTNLRRCFCCADVFQHRDRAACLVCLGKGTLKRGVVRVLANACNGSGHVVRFSTVQCSRVCANDKKCREHKHEQGEKKYFLHCVFHISSFWGAFCAPI